MDRESVVELVTIPDGEYFTVTGERLRGLSRRLAPTADEVRKGTAEQFLIIGGPRVVDLQTARQIPVLIASRVDGQRRWMVDEKQNFTWFITDIAKGTTRAINPVLLDKRRIATPTPSRSGSPPPEFEARVVGYGVRRVYLPMIFGPRWPAGRYAVTLVQFDRASNTIVFETKPARPEGVRMATAPAAFVQAIPGPIPDGTTANTLYISKGRVGAVVAMPARDTMVAESAAAGGGSVIPVSLIFLRLDTPDAIQVDMAVPATIIDGNVMTRFSLKAADTGAAGLSGEFQAYLCSGTKVIGPQPAVFP